MLIFLPFFAEETDGLIQSVSLIALNGIQPYIKISYFIVIITMIIMGVMTLALQNIQARAWLRIKTTGSLVIGAILVLLFIISSQPYAAFFSFSLLAFKALILIKRK